MKNLPAGICLLTLCVFALPRTALAHSHQLASVKTFPVTVVDDHGNRVHITSRPSRIVSLDPRDTETLFAIDAESRVVGDSSQYSEGATGYSRPFRYPSEWPSRWGRDYPTRSKQLTHVEGGYSGQHFNLETIVSLKPDLIFTLYSQTEEPTFQKMRDLGIKVVILDPSTISGILHDVSLVGTAVGNRSQAQIVATAIKQQITSVRKRLTSVRSRPRTYYEIDATNPTQPYTAGPGTFVDSAIQDAGGKNIAHNLSLPGCPGTLCYPQFSLESIVHLDPQVIVLGDSAYGTTTANVKSRSGWSSISAVKTGKVYAFDDELVSRAGPRIGIGISRLARILHPRVFGG
ncbi:MAG TPA: ABC transporter substrate-binding protein [Chloroflexota bacterium]